MLGQHFVRIGLLGSVGRFAAADRQRYARGARVVCRTPRGLEVGATVLSGADAHVAGFDANGIADERCYYYPLTGLLRVPLAGPWLPLVRLRESGLRLAAGCHSHGQ